MPTEVVALYMMLRITTSAYMAIRLHGEETYPRECCGVLLGIPTHDRGQVIQAIRTANASGASARNRYSIEPWELVRIEREARRQGVEIVGFYHSHPDHPAQWSETDLAEAHWLGCSYVITAVAQGTAAATHSFRLAGENEEDKRFVPELLIIDAEGASTCGTVLPAG